MFRSPVSKIISKDNRTYRECLKLKDKKFREREGLYLVEGENLVAEAAAQGLCELVLVSDAAGKTAPKGVDMVLIKDSLFRTLSDTEHSQGIIAVVKKKPISTDEFIEKISEVGANILVLDRLQDPGNIGTMIRTAEAAGYSGIVIVKGTADVTNEKVVRAAAGAAIRMPMIKAEDAGEAAFIADAAGKRLIGTSIKDAVPFYETDMTGGIALVIGNEGSGMSREFAELATVNVTIPMAGETESLNAAVAAGIIMYESAKERFRQNAGQNQQDPK